MDWHCVATVYSDTARDITTLVLSLLLALLAILRTLNIWRFRSDTLKAFFLPFAALLIILTTFTTAASDWIFAANFVLLGVTLFLVVL